MNILGPILNLWLSYAILKKFSCTVNSSYTHLIQQHCLIIVCVLTREQKSLSRRLTSGVISGCVRQAAQPCGESGCVWLGCGCASVLMRNSHESWGWAHEHILCPQQELLTFQNLHFLFVEPSTETKYIAQKQDSLHSRGNM